MYAAKIAYPATLSQQEDVASNLNKVLETTKRIAVSSQQKLSNLDELKQSILQKAFTGQLTSKSPELESI